MMRYLWVLIVTGLISLGVSGSVWAANWNSGKDTGLVRKLITGEIKASDLNDEDLCKSLKAADLMPTFYEMKKRGLDCLASYQFQKGYKPKTREQAFRYLRKYQNINKVVVPDYTFFDVEDFFGTRTATAEIYEALNPSFKRQVEPNFKSDTSKTNFCLDWYGGIKYLAENQTKNLDGSASWKRSTLRDGFVICQDAFNRIYLSSLFNDSNFIKLEEIFSQWIENDAPRVDVQRTTKNVFGHTLFVNKALSALELHIKGFNWTAAKKVDLSKWIEARVLESFPMDVGQNVVTKCPVIISQSGEQKEACKNGGILRALILLKAGLWTKDTELVDMAYVAFHRYMSGIRPDGSNIGDSRRGCTAADYNIWASQFMSDFVYIWSLIGAPLWDLKYSATTGSPKVAIEYSLALRDNFELINKYTLPEQWRGCAGISGEKQQQASVRGKDYYPLESFAPYFQDFRPDIFKSFALNSGRNVEKHMNYTSQAGSNYEVSIVFTDPKMNAAIRDSVTERKLQFEKSVALNRERLREQATKIREREALDKANRQAYLQKLALKFTDPKVTLISDQADFITFKVGFARIDTIKNAPNLTQFKILVDFQNLEKKNAGEFRQLRIIIPAEKFVEDRKLSLLGSCKKSTFKERGGILDSYWLFSGRFVENNKCALSTMTEAGRKEAESLLATLGQIFANDNVKKSDPYGVLGKHSQFLMGAASN